MERYDGERPWREAPYCCTWKQQSRKFCCKYAITIRYKKKYPKSKIDYWGSEVTKDLERELTKEEPINDAP